MSDDKIEAHGVAYTRDDAVGAGYLDLKPAEHRDIAQTLSFEGLHIDADEYGEVVGVEFLDLDAPLARVVAAGMRALAVTSDDDGLSAHRVRSNDRAPKAAKYAVQVHDNEDLYSEFAAGILIKQSERLDAARVSAYLGDGRTPWGQ